MQPTSPPRPASSSARIVALGLLGLSVFASAHAGTVEFADARYTSHGLVAVGTLPAAALDKFEETTGSFSGLTLDVSSWKLNADGSYQGLLFAQPDRGYNITGTTNYTPRQNRLQLRLKPRSAGSEKPDGLTLKLVDTVLYTEADGTPLTAFDPTPEVSGQRAGFPPLPQAFNGRISLDAEGIAHLADGTFFVCDEYGPYLYRFSADGKLLAAIRPPEAFIPKRHGADSFSSNNAGPDHPAPSPADPDHGRANNQGFEGLSLTPDAKTLLVLLQSATRQDGGTGGSGPRRHTRLLTYDVSTPDQPRLTGEFVVPLPLYQEGKHTRAAAQSAIAAIGPSSFLMMARGNGGAGGESPASSFRQILLVDFSHATNVSGTPYDRDTPLAPGGELAEDIAPAQVTAFIDLNDARELTKFGLSNGPQTGSINLSEKWESLTLAPALDPEKPDDFFLLVGNDNDFQTTHGFQDGHAFHEQTDIDSMILVYRVTIPGLRAAKP